MKHYDVYEEIENLREKVEQKLPTHFKEYLRAELDYSSEVSCGYDHRDLVKAQKTLIAAMERLLQ